MRDMGPPEGPWQTFSLCFCGHVLIKAPVARPRLLQRRHDGKVAMAKRISGKHIASQGVFEYAGMNETWGWRCERTLAV
jgi:hypothetical protein